jgi:hypothetical protein
VTAVILAGCAAEKPQPIPVAVVPAAALPPPPVTMAPAVIEAAGAYRAYVLRAAQITATFPDGASVERALAEAAAYETKQFSRGSIAYSALVALQSPNFVAGVRTYAVDPTTRRELAAKLIADPYYAQALPNAASAAGLISATLNGDAASIRHAGELMKQAAYDVQKHKWSLASVPAPAGRLAQAKELSTRQLTAAMEESAKLRASVAGTDPTLLGVTGDPMAPPYTTAVSRGLALAALAALGEGNDEAGALSLLEEGTSAACLNMAKLNLYQCLSVAKPYYEDVFCLGQHILLDTSQCVAKAAGSPKTSSIAEADKPPVGGSAKVSIAKP